MLLELAFPLQAVCAELGDGSKDEALAQLVDLLAAAFPRLDRGKVHAILAERERIGSTAMDHGIAMPHARLADLETACLAVGRSTGGIRFDREGSASSHLFFVLLAPDSPAFHLGMLGTLSRILRDENVRGRLMAAEDERDLYDQISLFCRQRGIHIKESHV